MPAGDEHLGKFVYCHSHRTPHSTGWCTVPVDSPTCTGAQGTASKIGLKAQTLEEAFAEVRAMGLPIYGEIKESP